jgi:formylmethanofuran dehydrogenase subunit E
MSTAAAYAPIEECTLAQVVAFHGHLCPGLAMGVQASQLALREVGPHSADEEVVAVVETDMCGVDAIQFLTGCTFGKGNLMHRDWGKNVYTFHRRSDERAVRISGRPDAWDRDEDHLVLFGRAQRGEADDLDTVRFRALHEDKSRRILNTDPERLFTVTEVHDELPRKARIYSTVPCDRCGEGTMEIRVHLFGGRPLCQPCFEGALAGA